MDEWLDKSLRYFRGNFDLANINYKHLLFLIYDEYSDRNLSLLISHLFNIDKWIIYGEIDRIVTSTNRNQEDVESLRKELEQKDFYNWIKSF